MACIIVRRLLISVHKWQSSGMAATHEYWSQHDAHLVYLPIISWAKPHHFFINQKSKFTFVENMSLLYSVEVVLEEIKVAENIFRNYLNFKGY